MSASHFDDPEADRRYAEGEDLLRAGDWCGAFHAKADLLRDRLAAHRPFTIGDRVLVEEVADLAIVCGRFDVADPLFVGLAQQNRDDGYHFAADIIFLKCVHVALMTERVDYALTLLTDLESRIGPLLAIPFTEGKLRAWESRVSWPSGAGPTPDRALFFSRAYHVLGLWLASEGKYGHAAVLLDQGATHARPPDSPAAEGLIPLRLAAARVRLEQGELDACDKILAETEDKIDPVAHPGWRASWLELSGRCGLLRGNFGPALARYGEVVNLCVDRGLTRATLGALLNQAEVLIPLNQLALAQEVLTEADALAIQLEDRAAVNRVAELRGLARDRAAGIEPPEACVPGVHVYWNGRPEAEPPAPNTELTVDVAWTQPPGNYLAFFEERELGVLRALADGDISRADDLLAVMEKAFAGTDSPLIRLRLHALTALLRYDAGYPDSAARMFDEATTHFNKRKLKPALWQALRGQSWCAAGLGDELVRRCDAILGELADSFSPKERAAYVANKWTADERALALQIKELEAEQRAVEAASFFRRPLRRWRLWRRLRAFLHRLDDTRRRLVAEAAGRPAPAPRDEPNDPLWRWFVRHPRRTAILSFLVLPDRVFVAWSSRFGTGFQVLPVSRLAIRTMARVWHLRAAAWERGEPDPVSTDDAKEAAAIERELATAFDQLPKRGRLVIVADNALHGFPFAALRVGGQYLVERFAISRGYDRAEWSFADSPPPQSALTVAVSRKVKVRELEGSELPNVIPETVDVAKWLEARKIPAPVSLVDDTASRAAVVEAWKTAGFVHVACHGTFEPDAPHESGLLLSPMPGVTEQLTIRDLGQLDLAALRHVTLSSCWGADGFVYPGRWVVSLPETLCRRGADSVLACLWLVDDTIGRAFVARFYQHLAKGFTRDEALRKVQLACLRLVKEKPLAPNEPKVPHPFFWAGYGLHGQPGRLRFA